jgi:hypothetical protein
MRNHERFDSALLSLRFGGEELNHRGVSIYDLSHVLLATQRIFHKAWLAQEGRLTKGAFPDAAHRKELALQLGERRRGSDVFALVPILLDPMVQSGLTKLADYVLSGMVGYYVGDVIKRVQGEKDSDKQAFITSIYAEVAVINNRVGGSGGVESIGFGEPRSGRDTVASFDSGTKDYLASIKGEVALGTFQEVKGRVYKFYPASRIAVIKRSGGRNVSIFLKEDDFNRIRYHAEKNPTFLFKGWPRYQFGVETAAISEFVADSIVQFTEA